MAWRPHGHARVNPNHPSAWGDCDRCGMVYNLDALNYQFDWRGPRLANLRIKVCRKCTDVPFEFWRPVILPPDPVARTDPRPEAFDAEMGPTPPVYIPTWDPPPPPPVTALLLDDDGNILVDDSGQPLVAQ